MPCLTGFAARRARAARPSARTAATSRRHKRAPLIRARSLWQVLREGDGEFHPTEGSATECHYSGKLIDGYEFDSSYKRGKPSTFAPNQVIPGWTEAMQLMVEGDRWELYIPAALGYGAQVGSAIQLAIKLSFSSLLSCCCLALKASTARRGIRPVKFRAAPRSSL